MIKLFSQITRNSQAKEPVIIVSGLPRSGTSMMMKMLAEGGLPVITDGFRRADEDNPNGYFELEVSRQLKEGNFAWLQEAPGKGVKVISALLEYLPPQYHYKVILMERDGREILASQKKMLEHRGQTSRLSDEEMEQEFKVHLAAVKPWLVRQPNMELHVVNYNLLMAQPALICEQVAEFLELPLNQRRMRDVPDRQLYRNRRVNNE
jgi:hypothetical protein